MTLKMFLSLTWLWLAFAFLIFLVLLNVRAPYGRHTRKGWGPLIPNRLGWVLMELPSLVVFSSCFLLGRQRHDTATWILFSLWGGHYIHRAIIYPWRTRTKGKSMPLLILLFAVFFNLMNGFLNGYYLGYLRPAFRIENRFLQPDFLLGLGMFITGFAGNFWADNKLIHLRKSSGNGYKIPSGGLFNYISCPNYFGEIIEWCGFAVMAWSLPALSFAVWTMANLIPRALGHHRWYRSHFPEYPEERKALLPGIL